MRKEVSIEDWRAKIETEMAGWKKLRYVYLVVSMAVVIFLLINRVPGYLENNTVVIILFAGSLGYILRHWNGREEKRIFLKILKKIEEIDEI